MPKTTEVWRLLGRDGFDKGAEYPIPGEFPSEETAMAAREEKLKSMTGGEGFSSCRDKIFVVRPDGTKV